MKDNRNPPASLYKYRSPDIGRLIDILLGNVVWASAPTDFNDPFDCYPHINLNGTYEEAIAWMRLRMSRGSAVVTEQQLELLASKVAAGGLGAIVDDIEPTEVWRDSVSQFGVVSFSSDCRNILMWSHYAKNHTGVAIEFSGFEHPFDLSVDVNYTLDRPEFRPLDPDRNDLMQRILLRKSKIWEYEQEWRYFQIKNGPGLVRFNPSIIKSIILGAAAQPEFVAQLNLILSAREDPLEIKKARFDPKSYLVHVD